MSNYGFVYVMRNHCMPGIFKVGFTNHSPMQRCDELSSSTSVPNRFEIVCYGEVIDAHQYEGVLHELLSEQRISKNREFFSLGFDDLLNLCSEIEQTSSNFLRSEGFQKELDRNRLSYSENAVSHFISQTSDACCLDCMPTWHRKDMDPWFYNELESF